MKLGQWIGLIALLICLYIIWQIREVLLLVFAAVILATALNRLALQLQCMGIKKRSASVMLSVTIFVAVIIGFFWLIVPPFSAQFHELTVRVPKGIGVVNRWIDQLETRIPSQLSPLIPDLNSLSDQAQPLLNRLLGSSFAFVSRSLEAVLKTLLVLVLAGMVLANPSAYRQVFIQLFPSFYRRRVDQILYQCEDSLGGWMTGAGIAMSVVGTMSIIGLAVLRIPAALALAVLAGFMNLIPNLGPTISVIPAMAIALLDAPWKSLAVLGLYFIIQQAEGNLITPLVMAHHASLLPALTLISQVFFLTFFGFLGLFLAIPLTVVGKIWLQEVLIKDVLDKWGYTKDPEMVLISDLPEGDESKPVGKVNQDE